MACGVGQEVWPVVGKVEGKIKAHSVREDRPSLWASACASTVPQPPLRVSR